MRVKIDQQSDSGLDDSEKDKKDLDEIIGTAMPPGLQASMRSITQKRDIAGRLGISHLPQPPVMLLGIQQLLYISVGTTTKYQNV